MFLESIPIQPPQVINNVTQAIEENTSELAKQALSFLWRKILPIVEILGGILVIYIIYKIILGISNHLLRKRVKRIDKNVQELNKKVDEILKFLKKKKSK